ncbi:MAG: cysteine synthase family protein [Planctomycetota bacterium]
MILDDITQAVGGTPLLRLGRYAAGAPAEILAKLEMFNPYSTKDRPVLEMIAAAERDGALQAGGTIIEATSGNTGIAIAMVCAVRGYKCVLVMSAVQSVERRKMLQALGAKVVLTPASGGTKAAREEALRLVEETGAYYIAQHDNPANPVAHEKTTAEELWDATDGGIDVLVGGLGTGGTLTGVARTIRPRKAEFRTVGVEPENAPFISCGEFQPHRMMGTSPGFVPGVLDRDQLDEIVLVSEQDAFDACREIARSEGLLVGISSGATALAARRLADRPELAGKTIVCVFADSGERYLSIDDLFAPMS